MSHAGGASSGAKKKMTCSYEEAMEVVEEEAVRKARPWGEPSHFKRRKAGRKKKNEKRGRR